MSLTAEAFGAFVNLLPGVDGLVHISQLASERVNSVEDVCTMGDELTVMVTDIDPQGKIRLSRQAVLEGWTAAEAREKDGPRKPSGGGNRGGSGDIGGFWTAGPLCQIREFGVLRQLPCSAAGI